MLITLETCDQLVAHIFRWTKIASVFILLKAKDDHNHRL